MLPPWEMLPFARNPQCMNIKIILVPFFRIERNQTYGQKQITKFPCGESADSININIICSHRRCPRPSLVGESLDPELISAVISFLHGALTLLLPSTGMQAGQPSG